jgi:sugar-specific transcriptional regulator TrmB
MNNRLHLLRDLERINLSEEEAILYVELLERPNTHLQLARTTGINRSKVYRIIEQLERRNLISRQTDDRGTFLTANDPNSFEIELLMREQELKAHRETLQAVIPNLKAFQNDAQSPFLIRVYEGASGLRQMQWHELKTQGELLVFGNSTIEDMVVDRGWAERMRTRTVQRGYRTREIYNELNKRPDFTSNLDYMNLYEARRISEQDLPVATPMIIYNDTVAIYQFDDQKRVGVEIVNAAYARTMKSVFELYWKNSKKIE